LLTNAAVVAVAGAVDKSPAQVLLRWGLQHNAVILPKSATESRIKENAKLFDFELTAAQMQTLDALDDQSGNTYLTWTSDGYN
jgi:2,5-diketo-D-gluconate reductase A